MGHRPQQLDQATLDRLTSALDHVFDKLLVERILGFECEAEQRGFYYRHVSRKVRNWGKPHECMFPGCAERSIKRSHTIPRSGPLALLAEGGHVVAPGFDTSSGEMGADLVGVADASTFPGFCTTHEGKFQDLEQAKELVSERDFALQFFRIVCREIRARSEDCRLMREILAAHDKLLSERGMALLREYLGDDFIRENKVNAASIRFEIEADRYTRFVNLNKDSEANLRFYQSTFFDPLHESLVKDVDPGLVWTNISVPRQIPVCLAGRGNFGCTVSGELRDVVVFVQVWPTPNATHICLMGAKKHEQDIAQYVRAFSNPPFRITSMVESWMVHGTDHWFMRPSAWNRIPPARQSAILNDILDETKSIGSEYAWSIFDDLRTELIANIQSVEPKSAGDMAYIKHESSKLSLDCVGTADVEGRNTDEPRGEAE